MSASGFSTPPTASADTCDSGFTEFFSDKAGTSTQSASRTSQKKSETTAQTRNQRGMSTALMYTENRNIINIPV